MLHTAHLGKDLIYEGIETDVLHTAHAAQSNQLGKDLIYEGIETVFLLPHLGQFIKPLGKDLIYEGIETPVFRVLFHPCPDIPWKRPDL